MALTEDQIAYYGRKLGVPLDEADIEARIARLTADGKFTGDIDVVVEIVETRMATMVKTPEQFAIPGEYSQSTQGNIKLLDRQLADVLAEQASGVDVEAGFVFVQPPINVWPPRLALDTEEFLARYPRGSRWGHRFGR